MLEEESKNTWENVAMSLPFLEDAQSIVIASNTFHARRVRSYLQKQRPDLALALLRGRDSIPGELAPIKPVLALYEWRRARKARSQG
ncbi:ElyC/SanA/YdcF family protein [Frondihabitans sp. 762G35]|uniref:ElyC/SanA/YdcF family protein n=1 Tax=Frondihabitans sp. 762G35 TaxID=1446794 RepID=UPI003FA4292E